MKKLSSIVLTLIMVAICSTTVFAAPTWGTGTTPQSDKSITGNAPQSGTVPIFGYIGEDAEITDPDPTNPTPPTVTPTGTAINVSVPVKVLWAAFASDNGVVTSPSYYIKNNSATVSLQVTMTDFTPRVTAGNAVVDSLLTLNLTGAEMTYPNLFVAGVGVADNTTAYSSVLTKSGGATSQWNFAISGNYTGGFAMQQLPEYDMTLRFALH